MCFNSDLKKQMRIEEFIEIAGSVQLRLCFTMYLGNNFVDIKTAFEIGKKHAFKSIIQYAQARKNMQRIKFLSRHSLRPGFH